MNPPTIAHAVALHEAGQTDAAAAAYERLLAADPRQPSLRHNLGLILLHQRASARALPLLEQAWAEDGAHDGWLQTLPVIGTVLHDMGLWEDAGRWLARAAVRAPAGSMLAPALGQMLRRIRTPDYLAPEVFDPQQGRSLLRHSPRESDTYLFAIDVVGARHPGVATDPVTPIPAAPLPGATMPAALFERILDKIVAEAGAAGGAGQPVVWLRNRTEPLHDPALLARVRQVKRRGLSCHLSTCLISDGGLRALAQAGLDGLTVVLADCTRAPGAVAPPPTASPPGRKAGLHHRADLPLLKARLSRLRQCLAAAQAPTRVMVEQRVLQGGEAERRDLKTLCDSLGFEYRPVTTDDRPLERLVDLLEGRSVPGPARPAGAEPPQAYLPRLQATRSTRHDCEWRFNQTVIQHDGTLALCRGVVDPPNMLGLGFLDTPHAEIEAAKYRHPFCTTCMGHGLSCSVPDAAKIG